jgi:hypothetical protein
MQIDKAGQEVLSPFLGALFAPGASQRFVIAGLAWPPDRHNDDLAVDAKQDLLKRLDACGFRRMKGVGKKHTICGIRQGEASTSSTGAGYENIFRLIDTTVMASEAALSRRLPPIRRRNGRPPSGGRAGYFSIVVSSSVKPPSGFCVKFLT